MGSSNGIWLALHIFLVSLISNLFSIKCTCPSAHPAAAATEKRIRTIIIKIIVLFDVLVVFGGRIVRCGGCG